MTIPAFTAELDYLHFEWTEAPERTIPAFIGRLDYLHFSWSAPPTPDLELPPDLSDPDSPGIFGVRKLKVRDPNLNVVGDIDDFLSAKIVDRYNDVGTWSVTMPADALRASQLATPGYGLIVTLDGDIVFSGPMVRPHYISDVDGDQWEIDGVSDDVIALDRLAYPNPADINAGHPDAVDTRSGIPSTIMLDLVDENAGPSALGSRQARGLVIGADPLVGTPIPGATPLELKWDGLLETLQTVARDAGLGFRFLQTGLTILFEVFEPTDRSASVVFSRGRETLAEYDYELAAPEANAAIVGGATDVVETQDLEAVLYWHRRIETFKDDRDSDTTAKLTASGATELAARASTAGFDFVPIDKERLRYRIDWNLGDIVTVSIAAPGPVDSSVRIPVPAVPVTLNDVITEATTTFEKDRPVEVTIKIGQPVARRTVEELLALAVRSTKSRLRSLEARP